MKPKRLTRQEVATVYAWMLKGKLSQEEAQQFCVVFNRLIMGYWSYAGLCWIKEHAWKQHEQHTGLLDRDSYTAIPTAMKQAYQRDPHE